MGVEPKSKSPKARLQDMSNLHGLLSIIFKRSVKLPAGKMKIITYD